MEPVVEERNEPTIPEQDGSLTQGTPEVEEQPPTYKDLYDMLVDPGTPDGVVLSEVSFHSSSSSVCFCIFFASGKHT